MIIAIDIGGTKIAAALMQEDRLIERRSADSPAFSEPEQLLNTLQQLCAGWLELAEGIGVACTGRVSDGRVEFFTAAGDNSLPLQRAMQEQFGLPVTLLNDAWAAAWGEYCLGRHGDLDTLVYLTISTGIGGGIVYRNRLLTSPGGLAAHLGHTSVPKAEEDDDQLCGCGRLNCVEAQASGTAIARRASTLLGSEISCEQVFARCNELPQLDALLDDCARAIAETIANIKAIIDTPLVLIGGSVGLAEGFIPRIEKALAGIPPRYRPTLKAATLGKEADLYGAALALQAELDPGLADALPNRQ